MSGQDDSEAEWLAQAMDGRTPTAGSNQPSALRTYMRQHYDTLMRLKTERGFSWAKLAEVLAERGLTKADGTPLNGPAVYSAATHERHQRSPQARKSRKITGDGRYRRGPRDLPNGSTLPFDEVATSPSEATAAGPDPTPTPSMPSAKHPVSDADQEALDALAELQEQHRREEQEREKLRNMQPAVIVKPGMRG